MQEDVPDSSSQNTPQASPEPPDDLRSLTRLVVGGVEVGIDELLLRLREWEIATNNALARPSSDSTAPATVETEGTERADILTEDSNSDLVRYALIGLIFETQGILQTSVLTFGRLEKLVSHYTDPFVQPIVSSRLFAPARNGYERLVERGQQEVDRWITLGREEDARSRVYAEKVITGTVDDSIGYLADNDEIRELIETQTTGLVIEVVEEIRERTVSMDILLEGMVRSLFHRQPRAKLPKPPVSIRRQGISLRPTKQYHKPRRKNRQR